MFKFVVCSLLVLISFNCYALDDSSALPDSNQKLLSTITEELGLKNNKTSIKKQIHDVLEFALKDNWYSYWVGNSDLKSSKFKDEKVRVVDVIIPTNNRIYNITFTYFPSVQQIFYTQKQFVEGSSDIAMEAFRKAKNNSDLKKLNETDNYAFFQKNGFVQFEIYHIKSPNALVSYIDYGLIDIK